YDGRGAGAVRLPRHAVGRDDAAVHRAGGVGPAEAAARGLVDEGVVAEVGAEPLLRGAEGEGRVVVVGVEHADAAPLPHAELVHRHEEARGVHPAQSPTSASAFSAASLPLTLPPTPGTSYQPPPTWYALTSTEKLASIQSMSAFSSADGSGSEAFVVRRGAAFSSFVRFSGAFSSLRGRRPRAGPGVSFAAASAAPASEAVMTPSGTPSGPESGTPCASGRPERISAAPTRARSRARRSVA